MFVLINFIAVVSLLQDMIVADVSVTFSADSVSDLTVPYMEWITNNSDWIFGIIASDYTPNLTSIHLLQSKYKLNIILAMHANQETHLKQHNENEYDTYDTILKYLTSNITLIDYFSWQAFTEDDSSGVGFPYQLLSSQTSNGFEAYKLFSQYLDISQETIDAIQSQVEKLTSSKFNFNYNKNNTIDHENDHHDYKSHINYAKTSSKKKLQIWTQAGFAMSIYQYFSKNHSDIVLIERANDDVGDLSLAISMARGAVLQYACHDQSTGNMTNIDINKHAYGLNCNSNLRWGIDLSLWWGVINGCINEFNDISYHKRHLYISYWSGASNINIEGVDLLFSKQIQSPLVKVLEQFGDFIQRHSNNNNSTSGNSDKIDIIVNILIPRDAGYMTPQYWYSSSFSHNFGKIMPVRQGFNSIGAFMTIAYPSNMFYSDPFPLGKFTSNIPPASSFSLASITPEYAPNKEKDVYYAESYINFGRYYNRTDAQYDLLNKQSNISMYRSMSDTRWGDIFNILVNDEKSSNLASILSKNSDHDHDDQLQRTPLFLLILGNVLINMTNEFVENIIFKKYIFENGNQLIWSIGDANPKYHQYIGCNVSNIVYTGRASIWHQDQTLFKEPFRFVPILNDINTNTCTCDHNDNVTILASVPFGNGKQGKYPLIIENRYGNGIIYTVMIPWFLTGIHSTKIADIVVKFFDWIFIDVQYKNNVYFDNNGTYTMPVRYMTTENTIDKTRSILIANNDDSMWVGKNIVLKKVPRNYTTCTELITNSKCEFKFHWIDNNSVNITQISVPSFDVSIFQFVSAV